MRKLFSTLKIAAFCALAAGFMSSAQAASWDGLFAGRPAFITDTSQPVRVAIVNNMTGVLPNSEFHLRTLARRYNAVLLNIFLDWTDPASSAQRILDTLKAGSQALPDHPEIQHLNVVLIGFSAGAAGAAITASSPLLSNPDPTKAPQRVLAVAAFDELDQSPYLPPPWTPFLFLADTQNDVYGGLTRPVEDMAPVTNHDVFARQLAAQGRPITVMLQPGEWHGGSRYGWNHEISSRFFIFWTQEILKVALPATPPTTAPFLAPDWRTYAGAYRGTYDVALNTNTQPWGNDERMTNVIIAPKASFNDPRPYIWLPDQIAANFWKTYAETGALPREAPAYSLSMLYAFVRQGADAASETAVDSPTTTAAPPTLPTPSYTSSCGFSSTGDANLIVNFDRAIASAEAVVSGGLLAGVPRTWANVLIVPLKRTVYSQQLTVQLTNITPVDGTAPLDLNVAAKYASPCP